MILKTIIDRLNQRIEVSNIFDRIYGLCELTGDKGWIYYIGDGQALPVTDYDAKVGTLFWAKRGKVNISKVENLRVSGCKQMYSTKFNLSAYAVVRKNNLPCDSEDAGDWVASRVFKLVSGRDYGFKDIIDVVSYEVIPNGYTVGDKTLPPNFEFATVVIDVEVEIVSGSEDTCYDICDTGDLPLPPDFLPCNPCLTEVYVDGTTIIGNGTPADPLIAIGGGGGGGSLIALPFTTDHLSATGNAYEIGNIVWYNGNVYSCIAANDSILPTNTSYWVNLGVGFPTVQQPSDWNATSGNNQILNKPTIPPAQVNSDWNSSSGVSEILNKPNLAAVATSGDYADLINTPSIPPSQVNSDWNSSSGISEILNKPSIPTATSDLTNDSGFITIGDVPPQVNSDWNATSGVTEIVNKPTIPPAQINSDWNASSGLAQILNKPTLPTIYKSTADTIGYQGSTNTVVYTQLIPDNTFAAGDIVKVTYRTRKTGTNGNQTLRIYVNATANLSGSPILVGGYQNVGANTFLLNQILRHLAIKTSNNNTEVWIAAIGSSATDYGLSVSSTLAINWTLARYFVFAIQSTSISDTNFGSMYLIEKL